MNNEKPIKTEEEHAAAMAEVERLWDAAPGSTDEARLNALLDAVLAYEEIRWPIDAPANAQRLQEAMEDIEAGRVIERDDF